MFSRMLGEICETWVLTRANNQPSIEATDEPMPADLHFRYLDLPPWARWWKRGPRGMRLYYVLWQFLALREGRKLGREKPFDYVWHLTMANAWIGSTGALVGPPFIFGPVGGGIKQPFGLLPSLGAKGIIYEVGRWTIRLICRYANPLARIAWRNAQLILAQTEETARWFPARHRHKVIVFQNAVAERTIYPSDRRNGGERCALMASRLLPLKGGALAVRALALQPRWRLIMCGSGPDEARLRRLAIRLGVQDQIEFRGQVSQEDLFSALSSEADVFLFPSLHDESPLAVAEAVAAGLPVVCLDIGGPRVIAGDNAVAVPARNRLSKVAKDLAAALDSAYERKADIEGGERVSMERRQEQLRAVVAGLAARR